ncbi:MAG: hypothetical protein ACTH5M_05270, partial [Psychrobacter sp.]
PFAIFLPSFYSQCSTRPNAYQALLKSPLDTYMLQEQSGKQYRIDRKQVAKLLNEILNNNYDHLTSSNVGCE